ncbi:uncharacterized protein KY384_007082 [Bacidia gigantensis]|uniref:uncharacterized protein n=1 Tax=Bacidia gigantensis TaxID=2732470 RepID=UPI001D058360|nr:uncharacterized protein KY384_007082 [Bacidia gigantensis]KAG8528165.1 hypothetical protein KY384_007082 [Bacidia gigantensis]
MSHLYSYSFERNADWSREYPGQQEIQDYLIGVAHKYELYRHIRFNSSVEEAHWNEDRFNWTTTVRRQGDKEKEVSETYQVESDFLISATGQLSQPKYPHLPEIEKFQGKIMHSARWDWNYSIRGKRVGIIGTGATAAQIIPEVAQSSSSLLVFQRSPAWVVPRHDHPISQIRRALYKYIPLVQQHYRASIMDERESKFEPSFYPKSTKHEFVKQLCQKHMLNQLPGEANASLRQQLTPNYPFSCKRIIVSDDFYPTLLRQNVSLETSAIVNVTEKGIKLANGTHHDLDVLILATGFHSTNFLSDIRIYGSNGYPLHSTWSKAGASAYLGITVPNLPNFGMLYGPNTNIAYNSLIIQIEAQSLYLSRIVSNVLSAKRSGKTLRIEPRADVTDAYNRAIQSKLSGSTFADTRCNSWFKDEKGRITNNWAGSAVEYQQRVQRLDWSDYEVLGTATGDVLKKGVIKWSRRKEEGAWSAVELSTAAVGMLVLGILGLWFQLR